MLGVVAAKNRCHKGITAKDAIPEMLQAIKQVVKAGILAAIATRDDRRRTELGLIERELHPRNWDAAVGPRGQLLIGGCDSVELARQFGTPLYVVDGARLQKNFMDFASGFRNNYPRVEIGYSYKTNPLPGVLSKVHELGAWAEVISHFELWLALQLGVPPARVVFNGPGKTQAGLELAVSKGVAIINVDNEDEIDLIARLAARQGRPQRIGVRVITSVGWSSQFGLSIASGAAFRAFERIRSRPDLIPTGLHIHLGTGIRDVSIYLQAVRELLDFAHKLNDRLGVEIATFDLGGGFGVPTVRPYNEWDLRLMANGHRPRVIDVSSAPAISEYGNGIASLVSNYCARTGAKQPLLFFEPGRAITSSAQTLLVEVLAVKPAGRNGFNVICNGGRNIAMPTSYEYHEVFAAANADGRSEARYDIFGPLCHPADVLFKAKRLPAIKAGDVLAIMDAGAYFVPNQMNFSNPRPAAVMVEQGRATLIRSRETFEDIVAHDAMAVGDSARQSAHSAPVLKR